MDGQTTAKVFDSLKPTVVLVALLEKYGKLSLPVETLKELAEYPQEFPTDFISRHGAMMRISHNPENTEWYFVLAYVDDPIEPGASVMGHACTRSQAHVGEVTYSEVRPAWALPINE